MILLSYIQLLNLRETICLDTKKPPSLWCRKAVYPADFNKHSRGFAHSRLTQWPARLRENGLLETIMQLLHQGLPSPQTVVKAGKSLIPILHTDERKIQILPCSNSICFYKRVGIWLSTLIFWLECNLQWTAPPSLPAHSYLHPAYREERLRNKRPCFHCLNAITKQQVHDLRGAICQGRKTESEWTRQVQNEASQNSTRKQCLHLNRAAQAEEAKQRRQNPFPTWSLTNLI